VDVGARRDGDLGEEDAVAKRAMLATQERPQKVPMTPPRKPKGDSKPITSFALSEEFAALVAPCADSYGSGEGSPGFDWPNNVLSRRAVVYESGVIRNDGEAVDHRVDPDELAFCRELAAELGSVANGLVLASEADVPWQPYFRVANVGDDPPRILDEQVLRDLFGGTISPLDPVQTEPFAEDSEFWQEVVDPESERSVTAWRGLLTRLHGHPSLSAPATARIGFYEYAPAEPVQDPPEGFEMRGSCLPRLVFAWTEQGSLVGLWSHAVWT
jgi:hypothetical protein